GVLSVEAAVPPAACRHHMEIPRHVRVPRQHGVAAGSRVVDLAEPGSAGKKHQSVRSRLRHSYGYLEDARPEAGAGQLRLRPRIWRRAPRRRKITREGTDLFVSLVAASMGPEDAAPRTLAPVQRAQEPRREHARVPDLELDRA